MYERKLNAALGWIFDHLRGDYIQYAEALVSMGWMEEDIEDELFVNCGLEEDKIKEIMDKIA